MTSILQPKPAPGSDMHSNDHKRPLQATSVPWGTSDIGAAVLFTLAAIVAMLAFVQFMDSVRTGAQAQEIASVGFGGAFVLAIVVVIAWRSQLRLLAALGTVLAISCAGVLVMWLGGKSLSEGDGAILGVPSNIILFSVVEAVFISSALLYVKIKHGAPMTTLGIRRTSGVRPYLTSVMYWLIAMSAVAAWALGIQKLDINFLILPESADEALRIAGGSIPIAVLLVGIFGPIAEEIFFRGFVFGGLRSKYGVGVALPLSAALFGVFHVAPGAMVPMFFLGLGLAWIYVRTGSLWPAIVAHGIQNTLAIVATSFN